MKKGKISLGLDKYECGAIFEALKEKRNLLLDQGKPTDTVDDVLIKVIDAINEPEKRRQER